MAKAKKPTEEMTDEKLGRLYWWWGSKYQPEWEHSWSPAWQELGLRVGFPEGSAGFYAKVEFQHCAYGYEALARKKRGYDKALPPKWPNGKPFYQLTNTELRNWRRHYGGTTLFQKSEIVTTPPVLEEEAPDTIFLPLEIRPKLASKNFVLQRIEHYLDQAMTLKGLSWGRDRKIGRVRTSKLAWHTLEDADLMAYGLPCSNRNTAPEQAVRRLLREIPGELPPWNTSSRDNK